MGEAGYAIPNNVEGLELVDHDAKMVIAIETGGMYARLQENGFDEEHDAILVHLKGQPARSTRRVLHMISDKFGLPVTVFTDGDPWSYRIYASVAYGSIKSAHMSELARDAARAVHRRPAERHRRLQPAVRQADGQGRAGPEVRADRPALRHGVLALPDQAAARTRPEVRTAGVRGARSRLRDEGIPAGEVDRDGGAVGVEVGDRYRDGAYLAANPDWHEEDAPLKAAWIHALLERNRLRPEHVGEVGCGVGGVLAGLKERMPDATFTGYEVSPQAHALCRGREAPGMSFRLADLLGEDSSVSFDLLLCIDVVEHVEDSFGFLRALKARADYTVFHIPLELFALSMVYRGFLLSQRSKSGHVHFFTKDIALALLTDCGYDVLDTCYTPGYTLPHAYGWKDTLANVARRLAYPVTPDLAVRLFGGFSLLVLAR